MKSLHKIYRSWTLGKEKKGYFAENNDDEKNFYDDQTGCGGKRPHRGHFGKN